MPYLPEFSSVGPFPLSFCTSLALLRFMEALSLEKEPLRFILPLYMSQTNTQEIRYVHMARTRSDKLWSWYKD